MWDTQQVQYLSGTPKAPLPKLQGGLFRLYTFSVHLSRWKFMVSRSTSSSEDRRTLPEGPIEPFHHSTDVGDLGGRTKSLIPYSCEDPQIPQGIHSLHPSPGSHWKGGTFRSSSRNTLGRFRGLQMEGGRGPPQDKVFGGNSRYTLLKKGTTPEVSMATRSRGIPPRSL